MRGREEVRGWIVDTPIKRCYRGGGGQLGFQGGGGGGGINAKTPPP